MKYLFSDWDKVSFAIQKSPCVFLFFDYDGTLTPIVSRAEDARFPPTIKHSIKKLQKNPKFTVAIISGRSLKDIKRMVGLRGITYVGNHGLEIEKKNVKISMPTAIDLARPVIKKITKRLSEELGHINGAYVEDKGATLSVHYRLAKPRNKSLIKKKFKKILVPFLRSKKIRITSGKEVLEARPYLNWNKGKAVTCLLKGKGKAQAVYVGDDITDVDGFRAVKGKGISIFVGSPKRSINADYFLRGPKDVEKLIEKLLIL